MAVPPGSRECLAHGVPQRNRRPLGGGDAPVWLAAAAGSQHTYDAPDSARRGVFVRVLPTTYAQLQPLQRTMGLRAKAGEWELLLRLVGLGVGSSGGIAGLSGEGPNLPG